MKLDHISMAAAILCVIFVLSTIMANRDTSKPDDLANTVSMLSFIGILIVAGYAIVNK